MGKQWKQCQTLFLRGSKITADGDCSHEIKRCLLLGRKVMSNLDRIFKSRDINLLSKVRLVKAMVFPVVMYGCESWTVKAERQRIAGFDWGVGEDSCEPLGQQGDPTSPFWRRSPLGFLCRNDAKAEAPVLWAPHAQLTHWKRLWCWEGLGAGEEGDDRGWDGWMASLTWWTLVWVNSGSWWWIGRPGVLPFMGSQRVGHTEQLNWTELFWWVGPCSVKL